MYVVAKIFNAFSAFPESSARQIDTLERLEAWQASAQS